MVQEEKNQKENTLRLSFTQIDDYLTCPLLYKFRYILKIKTPKSAAPTFGQVIHETLQHFFELVLQKKKVDKNTLLEIYENSWKEEGYSDKMDELSYKKKGEAQLSNYYDRYEEFPTTPLMVEKKFVFLLDHIKISGKIDRIDSSGGNKINIIDYKTGKGKSQSEVDKSLQMSIYALAAEELFPGKGIEYLYFHYLGTNEERRTNRTKVQIESTKEEIKSVADRILNKDFDLIKGGHCERRCKYMWICPAWQV